MYETVFQERVTRDDFKVQTMTTRKLKIFLRFLNSLGVFTCTTIVFFSVLSFEERCRGVFCVSHTLIHCLSWTWASMKEPLVLVSKLVKSFLGKLIDYHVPCRTGATAACAWSSARRPRTASAAPSTRSARIRYCPRWNKPLCNAGYTHTHFSKYKPSSSLQIWSHLHCV